MRNLALFDFDGTLARTLPAVVESYRYAFAEVLGEEWPGEDPADLERVLTVRFTDVCEQAAGERAPLLIERFRDRYLGRLEAPVALYAGALEALEELARRGVALGIVTNKTRYGLDADMERTGLAELPFAALVSADDTIERKPHPRPLLLGAERAGLGPGQAWYVGDGPHDVEAARAAGMRGVAALWGDFPGALVEAARPSASAAAPADLPGLIAPHPTPVSNQSG